MSTLIKDKFCRCQDIFKDHLPKIKLKDVKVKDVNIFTQ